MTKFLIIGQPRSGTWLSLTTLAQHPRIICLSEVFNASQRGMLHVHGRYLSHADRYYRAGTPVDRYFDDVLFRPEDGKDAIGCKVDYNQFFTADDVARQVAGYVASHPDVTIVHQFRRNLLASYVSWTTARESGVWRQFVDDAPSPPRPPLHVDGAALAVYMVNTLARRRAVAAVARGRAYIEITYESLVERYSETVQAVFARLGVPAFDDVAPVTVRQAAGSPEACIANYSSLMGEFAGSPLREHMA